MSFDRNYPASPSDRAHMIWAELGYFSILGKHILVYSQPSKADRVKSRDSKAEKRYHKLAFRDFCSKKNFCEKDLIKTSLQLHKRYN